MKNLKNLFLISSAIIIAIILIGTESWYKRIRTKFPTSVSGDKKPETCIQIPWDTVEEKIQNGSLKKLLLDIYPLKYTPDQSDEKFDLVVFYRDSNGKLLNVSKSISDATFEKEASFYINYLKNKKVPKSKVPWGYQLSLNSNTKHQDKILSICFSVRDQSISYPLLFNYDSCRVPPGCGTDLLKSGVMKETINTSYDDGKNEFIK
jgi:hypothetical protein